MLKKIFVASLAASLSMGMAQAATKAPVSGNVENGVAKRMLEKILNSIETASVDINLNDVSVVGTKDASGEKKSEVQINDASVDGMLSFGSDWNVDLVTPKDSTPHNNEIAKIYPRLSADASKLSLGIKITKKPKAATIQADFFSDYNPKVGHWEKRPLAIHLMNQINKSLLNVRIYSLTAEAKFNPKNLSVKEIHGTCKSDKILFDYDTGMNKQVEVSCVFNGVLTDKGYKLDLHWANK
jgi:hypothetical protein